MIFYPSVEKKLSFYPSVEKSFYPSVEKKLSFYPSVEKIKKYVNCLVVSKFLRTFAHG